MREGNAEKAGIPGEGTNMMNSTDTNEDEGEGPNELSHALFSQGRIHGSLGSVDLLVGADVELDRGGTTGSRRIGDDNRWTIRVCAHGRAVRQVTNHDIGVHQGRGRNDRGVGL